MAILTVYTKLLDKTLDGARIIDMGVVNDHKQKKDFWDTALVFVSKSNEIFPSEALYLEYLGWKAAKEANNYIIENSKDINEPHLSAEKQNEMELFFEDIQFLTRFYGCRVFDQPEKPQVPDSFKEFTLLMPEYGMKAVLHFFKQTQRYVIAAGSTIMAKTTASCAKGMQAFRKQVIDNKKLSQKSGELYQLLQDVEIPETSSSPSGAASFCAGSSRQGTKDWKDNNGNTYPTEWWKA